jgi:16S rRNA (guanine(966)-N(2))-methyltransferase RsmD
MRVIAGVYKGRRLKTPSWPGLRPTSDKLRETLCNILSARLPGARVLDGYAGTGAVGIEALSRGASHVTFVESDRRAAALIAQNLASCGVTEGFRVEEGPVTTVLERLARDSVFDVIVLDPPYDAPDIGKALEAAANRLARGGVLVLERATRRDPPAPGSLTRTRDVKSGDSTLTFYTMTP